MGACVPEAPVKEYPGKLGGAVPGPVRVKETVSIVKLAVATPMAFGAKFIENVVETPGPRVIGRAGNPLKLNPVAVDPT